MRAKLFGAILLAVLVAAGLTAPAWTEGRPTVTISEIRPERTERATRLVVACTGPLAYTYYSPDPLTLVVDIPEVDASRVPARLDVGTAEVESVRVTTLARADGRSLARLEVRLASLVPYQIYSKDQQLNLVFERGPQAAQKAEPAPAPPAPQPEPQAPAAPVAEATTPASQPAEVAKAAPAPREAAPVPAGPRATKILAVSPGDEGGNVAITIRADGTLKYQDFFLGNPDRLVIDFPDVMSRAAVRVLEVQQAPVKKIRLAQFSAASPKIARLVLDLSSREPYHIVDGRDGVKVVFGAGQAPKPAPLASLKTEPEASALVIAQAAPAPPPLPAPLPAVVMPDAQQPQAPSSLSESAIGTEKLYTGHPISLDFKDGDLQDIFRLFADISGMNVVVNPGVSGKVTLKLNEVPWDQALDLILKANGLGHTIEGNVIRIAKLSDLQREEQEKRKLAEEKALAGDLATHTTRISYAKATDLSSVLKSSGALSARGSINVDTRTNTMIIKDLPVFLDKSRELIAELDIPTPQVEIEARIVVTSRNFTRDLGIQWGFLNQQTPQFANTTNRAFPHSIILNGQGVPASTGIAPGQDTGTTGIELGPPAGIGPLGRGYAVNLPAGGFNSAIGITLGNIIGSFNLDAALTALERQGRGRLLSTPKVTTQNNQAAEIKQGVQIPIQTVANNTVTVQFKDAVLTLQVTPQITEAGTVILGLTVENNSADFANLVGGIPPINTQSAKTQVLVRDGATAVIGGIYQSNEQTTQNSTPFLGKLPLLGYLFRNRFVTSTNNELLLFITPRIVKGS
jgi:type IV pilus secretin PilQ/predicted competence protein